jgi:polysaccharide biosynthesis/export protein ExoF
MNIQFVNMINILITRSMLVAVAVYAIAATSKSVRADEYRLDSGDILEIVLLEGKDMSGQYTIDVDGTISLPGIGRLSARGETLHELEVKLRDMVDETIVAPSLAIQVIEYRPFFVLGDVAEGGKYAFLHDLNVMKAISLAKGFRRTIFNNDQFSKQLANIRAKQALDNSLTEIASARIRLARVLAEASGADSFEYVASSEEYSKIPSLDIMIGEERDLFIKRKQLYEAQVKQVETTIASRELEVASYRRRSKSQDAVYSHIEKEIAEVQGLLERGLVPVERLNRLVREKLSIRGRVLEISSLLRQSQVSLSLSKEKLISLTLGHSAQLAQEIRELRDRITNLESLIDGEQAILDNTDDGQLKSSQTGKIGYNFEIYRDGVLLDQKVDFNTFIEPGDTLIVLRKSSRLDVLEER